MLFEVRVHMIKGLMFCFILRISRLTVLRRQRFTTQASI